jgi:AcrR family transcriptional regulator
MLINGESPLYFFPNKKTAIQVKSLASNELAATEPPSAGKKRVGRPPGSNRDTTTHRIVGSALRLFTERGYAGTTFKDIAKGAGLTSPAIYQYYSSKSELYGAVLDGIYRELLPALERALNQADSLRDQLSALLQVLIETDEQNPDFTAFMSAVPIECSRQADLQAHFAGRQSGLLAVLQHTIDQAKARGELAADRSTDSLVMVLLGSVVGMALYQQGSPGVSLREAIEAFADVLDNKLFLPQAP